MSDKLFGITRTRSSVAKRRAGEDEPYEVTEYTSYSDTETGEEITDPERIAAFEKENGNGDHDSGQE